MEFEIIEYVFEMCLIVVKVFVQGQCVDVVICGCGYLFVLNIGDMVIWEQNKDVDIIKIVEGFDGCRVCIV